MTLDAVEFLRRFFLHVLPKGFVRIRHYGLLSNRFRKQLLPLARTLLAAEGREQLPPATPAQLRPLALSPLRQSHACRPTLHRRTTLSGRLRFLMTVCANPLCRLAPRTPSQQCVPQLAEQLQNHVQRHPQRPDRRARSCSCSPRFHHHRRRSTPTKLIRRTPQTAFNIHNPSRDHRDRERLRLPSHPQIENASDQVQRLTPKLVSEAFPMLASGHPFRTGNNPRTQWENRSLRIYGFADASDHLASDTR